PAFVGLARRVQKAWPEAETGCRLGAVADHKSKPLHGGDMGGVALDIGEERSVIARADTPEMGLERCREARRQRLERGFVARIGKEFDPLAFKERTLLGQGP